MVLCPGDAVWRICSRWTMKHRCTGQSYEIREGTRLMYWKKFLKNMYIYLDIPSVKYIIFSCQYSKLKQSIDTISVLLEKAYRCNAYIFTEFLWNFLSGKGLKCASFGGKMLRQALMSCVYLWINICSRFFSKSLEHICIWQTNSFITTFPYVPSAFVWLNSLP